MIPIQTSIVKAKSPFAFHDSFYGWKGVVGHEESTVNGKRHYLIDGVAYPSITTVLAADDSKKESLDRWRKRVGSDKADRVSHYALSRGTTLHGLCEAFLTDNQVSIKSHSDRENFMKMRRVFEEHLKSIYCLETPLYSRALGVAGRVDMIADASFGSWECTSAWDFKTSTKTKYKEYIPHYFTQAAAYAVMFEEMTGISVPQVVIVIATDELSECQVFVEKTRNWMHNLNDAIDIYRKSLQNDEKTSTI